MPKLFRDIMWIWEAFDFLNRRRSYSFSGPHPISVEAMHAYLCMKGIRREDDVDLFLETLPQLDDLWIGDWGKRAEADRAKKKK